LSRSLEWKRGYQAGYQAGWRRYHAEVPVEIDGNAIWPQYLRWAAQFQVWTDERLEFIGREFAAGTPIEIIDDCARDMDGAKYELSDLADLIEARGWRRPPGWDEDAANADWYAGMKQPIRGGLGPFGVVGYREQLVTA
jgi:hypothetical protein